MIYIETDKSGCNKLAYRPCNPILPNTMIYSGKRDLANRWVYGVHEKPHNNGVHSCVIVYHVTKGCIARKRFCQENQIKWGPRLPEDDVSFCGELWEEGQEIVGQDFMMITEIRNSQYSRVIKRIL